MDIRQTLYFRQADLLIQILPIISKIEDCALKGGTGINFLVRDLPRLSVDIDLTYLPLDDRSTALKSIDDRLKAISDQCQKVFPDAQV